MDGWTNHLDLERYVFVCDISNHYLLSLRVKPSTDSRAAWLTHKVLAHIHFTGVEEREKAGRR